MPGGYVDHAEVHPRVAMPILRHGKIAMTMEIFTEVPSAATREALRKLGRWLDETPFDPLLHLLPHQDQPESFR